MCAVSVFSCAGAVWWISMSTTNNIAQARKLVEQLRIEAGIERIKVRQYFAVVLYCVCVSVIMHPHLTTLSLRNSLYSPSSFFFLFLSVSTILSSLFLTYPIAPPVEIPLPPNSWLGV